MSRLRTWRERKGYTRDELARLVGAANPISVYRWEQPEGSAQRRVPAEDVLKRLYRLSHGEIDANSFYTWPDLEQVELPLEPTTPAPLLDGVGAPELQDAA